MLNSFVALLFVEFVRSIYSSASGYRSIGLNTFVLPKRRPGTPESKSEIPLENATESPLDNSTNIHWTSDTNTTEK